jgi:rhamnose transport system ATP-binding protein
MSGASRRGRRARRLARIEREAEKLFARLEVSLPVRARVKDLSVAQRHFVEIARALSQDARVVIMDEPTAALSQREIRELYRIIAQLRAPAPPSSSSRTSSTRSSKSPTATRCCATASSSPKAALADITEPELVALMVGRAVHQAYPKAEVAIGAPLLEVKTFLPSRPNSTTSASRCAKARSSASTAWSAPAARK